MKRTIEWEETPLDINFRNEDDGGTVLHSICSAFALGSARRIQILEYLLSRPGVLPDLQNKNGETPLWCAATNGLADCVRTLLQATNNANPNDASNDGSTPLRQAAADGHLDAVKALIAYAPRLDLGKPGRWNTDAIGQAAAKHHHELANLLTRYHSNQNETKVEILAELESAGRFLLLFSFSLGSVDLNH